MRLVMVILATFLTGSPISILAQVPGNHALLQDDYLRQVRKVATIVKVFGQPGGCRTDQDDALKTMNSALRKYGIPIYTTDSASFEKEQAAALAAYTRTKSEKDKSALDALLHEALVPVLAISIASLSVPQGCFAIVTTSLNDGVTDGRFAYTRQKIDRSFEVTVWQQEFPLSSPFARFQEVVGGAIEQSVSAFKQAITAAQKPAP